MKKQNVKGLITKVATKLGKTGFFHVFGSSVINKIIGFASGIVLVRIISKTEYGIFSYANNLLNFFMIACGLGVASGVLQMCSEKREASEKEQIYQYACRTSFISNIILALCILFVAFFIPLKIEGANFCLGFMCLMPLLNYTYETQSFYLRTQLRNKEYATANTFVTVIIFVLSCGLSYLFQVKGLIIGKYISYILGALFIMTRFKVPYVINKKVQLSKETKKSFWNISLISMMNNGLSSLLYLLDIFILGLVIPDSEVVASYKVATNIPTALAFIPAAFVTYVYPYFAQNKDKKKWVKKKYFLTSLALAGCSFSIAIVMFVLAPWVIPMLFGSVYADAVPCFRILCVSFAITSVFRVLPGNILVTQRRLKFNLFIAALSSIINTIFNVLFITRWQSMGAAYANLATVVVTSILNMSYLMYVLNKKDKTIKEEV